MSAALSPAVDPLFDRLHALTTPAPSADDLRVRAEFWRQYLRTAPNLRATHDAMVSANCAALDALAEKMERPSPPVQLVARREDALAPVRPTRKPAKPHTVTAEQFWTLHSRAVRNMIAAHGLGWKNDRPEETVELTLPPRLCSYVGPLGGRIRWRRDHRVPAARYWPEGRLPEGVEALPVAPRYTGPMDRSWEWTWKTIQEQVITDRRLRAEAVAARMTDRQALSPSYPPMLKGHEIGHEVRHVAAQCHQHTYRRD